jgi:arginine exporter protein ArgO
LSGEVKAIWLAFGSQLMLMAVLIFMHSRKRSPQKVLLCLCGVVLFLDAMLIRGFVSPYYLPAQFLMITGLIILVGCFFITWDGVLQKPAAAPSS